MSSIQILGIVIGTILFLLLYKAKFKRLALFKKICMAGLFLYLGYMVSFTVEIVHLSEFSFYPQAFADIQFVPIVGLVDLFENAQQRGYYDVFIRLFGGNLLLFAPLGFVLPFVYKKYKLWNTVLIGFIFSLSIELTQLISNLIGGCSRRVVEIDDLILNTAGALLGYLCFTLARFIYNKIFRKDKKGTDNL